MTALLLCFALHHDHFFLSSNWRKHRKYGTEKRASVKLATIAKLKIIKLTKRVAWGLSSPIYYGFWVISHQENPVEFNYTDLSQYIFTEAGFIYSAVVFWGLLQNWATIQRRGFKKKTKKHTSESTNLWCFDGALMGRIWFIHAQTTEWNQVWTMEMGLNLTLYSHYSFQRTD